MAANEDPPDTSSGEWSVFSGRTKWATGIGLAVFVVALVGLGLDSFLQETALVIVFAIAIATIGGAAIALLLVSGRL